MLNLKYPWRLEVANLCWCAEIWVNVSMLDTSSRVTLQNHGAAKTTLTWSNKTNKITKKRAFNSKRTFNRQDQCYYQKETNMHNSKAKKKKTLPVGCFFIIMLHNHQAEENWRRKRWVFSIGKEHSIGKISVTNNRKQTCITTKQNKKPFLLDPSCEEIRRRVPSPWFREPQKLTDASNKT